MFYLIERLQFLSYIFDEETIFFVSSIVVVFGVFLLYVLLTHKRNKNTDSLKKFPYRKTPKLYDNYLEKHKLEKPEGAHYHSDNWSTNPKLHNGIEFSLEKSSHRRTGLPNEEYIHKHNLDTFKIKIECPLCQSVVTKKRHPISRTNHYSCNNTIDCNFNVIDINRIYPFNIIDTGKPPAIKQVLDENKDF